ncbi:hypothetical protein VOLCADRAFT_105425 [Volvox carteri f. nagariensis]|uniref:Uncharacterized protein n=1 Tax=Volvox carteri f. nagariensis TaxID=3068 RepID=D8U0Q1_VOLCA|nr:uncharacterized protein VOLCADRAFT_105425 [Volvox carteri f. nagariensis]EFJ46756.1 hypothetical protein VOLCADRAFT_105425 [Volvox carteri f. nagariensis]|eukprot:XP_002952285.1 hypothetical protein VOLCADRAFT_105425 [Volvox carteri f. nagariensis]
MQLGRIARCPLGTHRLRTSFTVPAPPRSFAPPAVASQRQKSVIARAKRSSKRLKKQDASETGGVDSASGWDAALANVPTKDEAAWAQDGDVSQEASDLNASASAERTSAQGPDPSESAPSTSYAESKNQADSSRKPKSTVITLAEYNLLMDAVATKEKELAAQREKAAREAAGSSALAVPEVSPLDLSRQGFQAFALDGGDLELLVSETKDGKLLLSDSYVAVKSADGGGGGSPTAQYSRPHLDGEMPSEPLLFQAIPWTERGSSDMFKRKAATNKVKKVYFLCLEPSEHGGLESPVFDLDNVFVFDGKCCCMVEGSLWGGGHPGRILKRGSRVLSRSEVRVVGSLPMLEPVLRIRPRPAGFSYSARESATHTSCRRHRQYESRSGACGSGCRCGGRPSGITLEESFLLPDPIEVSMNTASGLADMSPEELAERMEELEKAAESLDEFDEMPDAPSVDMM